MEPDAGRRRRLAIIIVVVIVVSALSLAFQATSTRLANDDAHALAEDVFDELDRYDADEMDTVWNEYLVDGWSGEQADPFRIDGRSPDVMTSTDRGFVVRYRVERWGKTRCVDARWPPDSSLRVEVRSC